MNFIKGKYIETMADMSNIYLICKDNTDCDSIICTLCELWTHRVCTKLTTIDFKFKSKTNAMWYSSYCINTFPFQNINDHQFRFLNTKHDLNVSLFNPYEECSEFNFKPFDMSEYNCCDFEKTLNLIHFFIMSDHSATTMLKTSSLLVKKNDSGLSFINFNVRGLRTNFNKIENLINQSEIPFDIIAISETWLVYEDCSDIMLEVYEGRHVVRKK